MSNGKQTPLWPSASCAPATAISPRLIPWVRQGRFPHTSIPARWSRDIIVKPPGIPTASCIKRTGIDSHNQRRQPTKRTSLLCARLLQARAQQARGRKTGRNPPARKPTEVGPGGRFYPRIFDFLLTGFKESRTSHGNGKCYRCPIIFIGPSMITRKQFLNGTIRFLLIYLYFCLVSIAHTQFQTSVNSARLKL
jgi:hypothetical protein